MTLEEAIHNLIGTGEKDPLTIARKISERYDVKWLAQELVEHSEDIVAQFAREALGKQRRSAEVALRTGDQVATSELKLRSYWVPEIGYKPAHELTAKDLRARALWYDGLATSAARRADWCRQVAEMMDAEGVETLATLKASLPPLPEERELAA